MGGVSCSIHVYHDLSLFACRKIYLFKYPCREVRERGFSAPIDRLDPLNVSRADGELVGSGARAAGSKGKQRRCHHLNAQPPITAGPEHRMVES